MSRRLRKIVALWLSGWLFVLGSGFAAVSAEEIEHDLRCVQLADQGPGKGNAACGHGCAAHFSAHLAAIPAEALVRLSFAGNATRYPRADISDIGAPSFQFFPPPKVSLK